MELGSDSLQLQAHYNLSADCGFDDVHSPLKRSRKVSQFSLQGYGSSSTQSSPILSDITGISNYYGTEQSHSEDANIVLVINQNASITKDQASSSISGCTSSGSHRSVSKNLNLLDGKQHQSSKVKTGKFDNGFSEEDENFFSINRGRSAIKRMTKA
ncbi:hypothetical protein BY996DRAFT_6408789 [Phakopsora pachyrhizi]|nr:hypothetical protein BY996DRAFT_6408789 [Phakopsora pachyrhizi]